MLNKWPVYLSIAVLSVGVVTGWSSGAKAITPTGPGLEDANGVYLGQVLSVQTEVNDSGTRALVYTTYLPSVNGILQFNSGTFDNVVQTAYFDKPDCQGKAYMTPDNYDVWIHPWVVRTPYMGLTYKVASSTSSFIAQSVVDGTGCLPVESTSYSGYKLIPVTLPFDLNSIALPYKITQ